MADEREISASPQADCENWQYQCMQLRERLKSKQQVIQELEGKLLALRELSAGVNTNLLKALGDNANLRLDLSQRADIGAALREALAEKESLKQRLDTLERAYLVERSKMKDLVLPNWKPITVSSAPDADGWVWFNSGELHKAGEKGPAALEQPSCKGCRYSANVQGAFLCRRNPPVYRNAQQGTSGWPCTDPGGWCGEFEEGT